MDDTGCTRLGLHLDDLGNLPPQVAVASSRPGVGELAHRAGRRDRIDRDHLRQLVGDACRRLVPVGDQTVRVGLRLHTWKLGASVVAVVGEDADPLAENY